MNRIIDSNINKEPKIEPTNTKEILATTNIVETGKQQLINELQNEGITILKKEGLPTEVKIGDKSVILLSTNPDIMLTGNENADKQQILRMKRIASLPFFIKNIIDNIQSKSEVIYTAEGREGFTHDFIIKLANYLTGYGVKSSDITITTTKEDILINNELKSINKYKAIVGVTDFITNVVNSVEVSEPEYGIRINKFNKKEELYKKTHPDRVAFSKAERNAYERILPPDVLQVAKLMVKYLLKKKFAQKD